MAIVPAKLSMPNHHPTSRPAMTTSWLSVPVVFWPIRSTSTPLTSRRTAPASVGTATIRPFCAGSSPSSAEMIGASGPSMTQTMNETSK